MGKMKNAYKCFVGNKPLVRPRQRMEDNIKMELTEIRREGMGWIHLAQDWIQWRVLVKAALSLRNST